MGERVESGRKRGEEGELRSACAASERVYRGGMRVGEVSVSPTSGEQEQE